MNNHAMIAARSDVYSRPDIYDMEYEGADNLDALFFAGLLQRRDPHHVAELACGSGRVALTLATALPMLLFRTAGFEVVQQFGDYRFSRVDRTSEYVVTVAQRPPAIGEGTTASGRGFFT